VKDITDADGIRLNVTKEHTRDLPPAVGLDLLG
jgi:hypothetical protein